jgi:hypothetical protein
MRPLYKWGDALFANAIKIRRLPQCSPRARNGT